MKTKEPIDEPVIKFTIEGNAVRVIQPLSKGFLVEKVYEDEETGEMLGTGRPYTIEQIYDKAPVEGLDAAVLEYRQRIEKLREEHDRARERIRQATEMEKSATAKITRYSQLKDLFEFIDGKITHYLLHNYSGYDIVPIGDTKAEYARERGGKKLLVLFGDSKGDLRFKLNQYSDGSGSYSECEPFTSYEAALEALKERITNEPIEKANEYVVACAKKHGVPLPEGYEAAWVENSMNAANSQAAEHEKRRLGAQQQADAFAGQLLALQHVESIHA